MDTELQARSEWVKTLKPKIAGWEITEVCNMKCVHCFTNSDPTTRKSDELSTEEALDLLRQLKEIGVQTVVFSGGEPLLRKDWYTLAQEAAALGMKPGMISNGFFLDDAIAGQMEGLKQAGFFVGLSVDGNEKVHDYLRQTKGAFKNVTRALALLKEKGIPASAITQVNRRNIEILPEIRDHVFQYNIYTWQLQMAVPRGRLARHLDLVVTPRQYLELAYFIAEQKKIFTARVSAADCIGYYTELEPNIRPEGEWQGCQAGLQTLGITSNGSISGCFSLFEPVFLEGNIRSRKLKDIWFDPDLFKYSRNFKEENMSGYCRQCPQHLQCRAGCVSTAYTSTGSFFDNYFCALRIMAGKTPAKIKFPKL